MVGDRVEWKKIKGNSISPTGKNGFGTLQYIPLPGSSLWIDGDYGLTTSEVLSVEEKDSEIIVITSNSTYLITRMIPY